MGIGGFCKKVIREGIIEDYPEDVRGHSGEEQIELEAVDYIQAMLKVMDEQVAKLRQVA